MSGRAKRSRKKSPSAPRSGGSKRGRVHFWTRLLREIEELDVQTSLLQSQLTDNHPLFHLLVEKAEAKSTTPSTIPAAFEGEEVSSYYFVLAIFALQNLLPIQTLPDANAAVALCVRWTRKFCKTHRWGSATSRLLVGRSLVVVAAACTQALPVLANASNTGSIIMAAVLALDAATNQSLDSSTDWSTGTQTSWMEFVKENEVSEDMLVPTKQVDWSIYSGCLDAIKSTTNQVSAAAAFDKLPKISYMDMRLALKRWTAVFMTWYGGQSILLEAALAIINTRSLSFEGVTRILPIENKKDAKKKDAKVVKAVSVPVPSNVTHLAIACRLIHIVADVESGAGCRPPSTDGWESHMQQLLGGAQRPERSNLREISTRLVYHVLEWHSETLASRWVEFSALPRQCRARRVPEEFKLVSSAPPFYQYVMSYYPYVRNAINCLTSCVEDTQLQTLAAAWVLSGPRTDCKLAAYAVDKLRAVLECTVRPPHPPNLDHLELDKPLLLASQAKSRKRKATGKSKNTWYCGLLPETSTFGPDEKLALFLRAANLLEILLQQLEACYDTRLHHDDNSNDAFHFDTILSSQEAKRKAAAGSASTTTNKRRKKTGDNTGAKSSFVAKHEEVVPYRCVAAPEARFAPHIPFLSPIVGSRKTLAQSIVRVIILIMRDSSVAKALTPLQSQMRKRVSLEHVYRLTNLSGVMNKVSLAEINNNVPKTNISVLEGHGSNDKSLWDLHMELHSSIFLGSIPDADGKGEISLVDLQSKVFEHVALLSPRHAESSWPVWIDPAHEHLLATGLSVLSESNTSSLDKRMVNGFIEELSWLLSYAENITSTVDSDKTAFSLHVARFFAHALLRLPVDDQNKALSSLLGPMHDFLGLPKDQLDSLFSRGKVSSFFARLLTVCVNIVSAAPFSREARLFLATRMKAFYCTSSGTDSADEEKFQSVFDPRVPSIPMFDSPPTGAITKAIGDKIQSVLEDSFDIAFATASSDECHLLFSSWNGLGQSPMWNEVNPNVTFHLNPPDYRLSTLLTEIRNDVCLVCVKLKRQSGGLMTKTMMESLYARKLGRESSSVKNDLQLIIRKSVRSINELVDRYFAGDEETTAQNEPVALFSVLEMCASAISFAISCVTHPDCNPVEDMQKAFVNRPRARAYSSDSEGGNSEEGSVSPGDALLDVVDRLLDISDTMGGAPCHPDWLDERCQLRTPFTFRGGLDACKEVQGVLSSLLLKSQLRAAQLRERALGLLEPQATRNQLELGLNLCTLHEYPTSMASCCEDPYGDRDYATDVATVCGLKTSSIDVLMSLDRFEFRMCPTRAWCGPSAQTILGSFNIPLKARIERSPESPELRAAGEWEVLLSNALTAAAVQPVDAEKSFSSEVRDLLGRAERWDGVLFAALEALVPVSALRRFCCLRKGRAPHPLWALEVPMDALEDLISDYVDEVTEDIDIGSMAGCVETLATVARVPQCGNFNVIALNLMQDSRSFELLYGTEACSLSLQAISELSNCLEGGKKAIEATKAVLSRVLSVIELHGAEVGYTLDIETCDKPFKLLAGCGVTIPSLTLHVLGEKKLDPLAAFRSIDDNITCALTRNETALASQRQKYIKSLFELSCHKKIDSDSRAHQFLIEVTNSLVLLAHHIQAIGETEALDLLDPAVDVLSSMSAREMSELVEHKLSFPKSKQESLSVQPYLCKLFALLLTSDKMQSSPLMPETIYTALKASYPKWKSFDMTYRSGLVSLSVLYASSCGKTLDFGSMLLNDFRHPHAPKEDIAPFESIKFFIGILALLRNQDCKSIETPRVGPKITPSLPPKCTFFGKGDFREQHWYNCYTCGLVDDKGCCSLCAVVCHANHMVEYSRFSPFFCDCGGQVDENACSEESVESRKCLCLTDGARDNFYREGTDEGVNKDRLYPIESGPLLLHEAVAIFGFMGESSENALSSFSEKEQNASWIRTLVDCSKTRLETWTSKSRSSNTETSIVEMLRTRKELLDRSGWSPPESNSATIYSSMGSSVAGTLITSLNQSIEDDAGKRNSHRSIIDADARGRFVAAEKTGIFFFTLLPLLGSRVSLPQFTRKSLCSLSSISIGMLATGLKFSPGFEAANESSVLVWDNDLVKVVFMKGGCSVLDRITKLEIKISSDGDGVDGVIKCEWLTEHHVLVGCRRSLQVFDLRTQGEPCEPCLSVPHRLRHFTVVTSVDQSDRAWRMYLVSNEGRLRSCGLSRDLDNTFSVGRWEQHDDALGKLCSSSPEENGCCESECLMLEFLAQSRVLTCHTKHGVLALCLDGFGKAVGGFEFMKEKLPQASSNKGVIVGPFLYWRELGMVHFKSQAFFCVCCTARGDTTKKAALVVTLFNGSGTVIQKVTNVIQSVEGMAVLSIPTSNRKPNGGISDVSERNVLVLLTGNGILHVYKEVAGAKVVPFVSPTTADTDWGEHFAINQNYEVLAFEEMENVSTSSYLKIYSNGLDSTMITHNLSPDNDLYVTSPHEQGFTLAISLCHEAPSGWEMLEPGDHLSGNEHIIGAIRVHVGSTSKERTPRSFKVMGRLVDVLSGSKGWYSVILDHQELAYAVRLGFIVVEFSESHDPPRGAIVDAIEVYATERKKVEKWLPFYPLSWPVSAEPCKSAHADIDMCIFEHSFAALSQLKRLCVDVKPSKAEKALINQVIQETTFTSCTETGKLVDQFLNAFELDETARSLFHDKATLMACYSLLGRCKSLLAGLLKDSSASPTFVLVPILRSCLKTAARIARARPFNYRQVADETSRSIASDASSIIIPHIFSGFTIPELIEDLVDLMLLETALANGSLRGRFGLEGLCDLLRSPQRIVAEFVCKAVSKFCRGQNMFQAQRLALGYVCDSCLCIIENDRFCCGEGSFDLCPSCWRKGNNFLVESSKPDSEYVVINGKNVGASQKLTCGEFQTMVLKATQSDSADTTEHRSNQLSSHCSRADPLHHRQLFDVFMGGLSHGLTGLLTSKLRTLQSSPRSVVLLCIDLFQHSVQTGRDLENSKKILQVLTTCLASRIEEALGWHTRLRQDSVLILEGLSALLFPNRTQRRYLCGLLDTVEHKVDPNTRHAPVLCSHGEPAALKVAQNGSDGGKPFHCCSQSEACRFFQWAAESVDTGEGASCGWFSGSEELGKFVWDTLSEPSERTGTSVPDILCVLVGEILDQITSDTSDDKEALCQEATRSVHETISSGTLCSLHRLGDEIVVGAASRLLHEENDANVKWDHLSFIKRFVECSFQLVALAGSLDSQQFAKWLPILSRTVTSKKLQGAVQKLGYQVLNQFCGISGTNEALDYFDRAIHFRNLHLTAQELLDYCRIVNEKARRSRESWDGNPVLFSQLSIADVIGVNLLVSEDASSLDTNKKLNAILSELFGSVSREKSEGSWGRFCEMKQLSHLGKGASTNYPPLVSLFAVACAASPPNQTRAFRLIHAGLKSNSVAQTHGPAFQKIQDFLYPNFPDSEVQLKLPVKDALSFVIRFVLLGHSSEIRSLGSGIVFQLLSLTEKETTEEFLNELLTGPLLSTGSMGKRSADFFNLLQSLVSQAGLSGVQVKETAHTVESFLVHQLTAIQHDRQNGEYIDIENRSGLSVQKKRYEFSRCSSCRLHASRHKTKTDKLLPVTARGSSACVPQENPPTTGKVRCPPEQVTPQVRGKLGLSSENCTNSEFATFFSLRYRIALYSLHLEIESTRRYVKTIKVYFTSRPLGNRQDAAILKSPEYSIRWQLCGTFNLTRGCNRASINLKIPVVAANLKIEYLEFYDRPGLSKSSVGRIISCPRCSGDVNVAHGVCANCGEAAFQCRKCRHINYDRLDAFLCVECGYSASGSFQFEYVGGMATNAVAITNNEELDRTKQMLKLASRCYADCKSALKHKLSSALKTRKTRGLEDNAEGTKGKNLSDALKRAFQGNVPSSFVEEHETDLSRLTLDQIGKPGSILKLVARPERHGDRSPIFSSARQSRSSSSSRRPENILIRGLGGDGEDESASELLSTLLESGGLSRYASSLESGDPLSRLLASVSSRQPRTSSHEQNQEEREKNNQKQKKERSNNVNPKDTMEVCDRFYALMVESEREVFELERRIDAWENLETGKLCVSTKETEFNPSHCSSCSGVVALHLMLLWMKVFELDPDSVEITEEFVSMLLREDTGQHLRETRRSAVKAIAIQSKKGQTIVLEALRNRLVLLRDTASSEVLRSILESVGTDSKGAPFVDLAKEVLEKGVDGHSYRVPF